MDDAPPSSSSSSVHPADMETVDATAETTCNKQTCPAVVEAIVGTNDATTVADAPLEVVPANAIAISVHRLQSPRSRVKKSTGRGQGSCAESGTAIRPNFCNITI